MINKTLLFTLTIIFLGACNFEKKSEPTSSSNGSDSAIEQKSDSNNLPVQNEVDTDITSHSPATNLLIIPGHSIGKIELGMSQEAMLNVLGKPDSVDAAMGTYVYTWLGKTKNSGSELNVVTGYADSEMKSRTVKLIRTTSKSFMTKNGAAPGLYFGEIKKLFPDIQFIKTYQSLNHKAEVDLYGDEAKGIVFAFLANDQKMCVGIRVMKPYTTSSIIDF